MSRLHIEDWGLTDYQVAFHRQTEMVRELLAGTERDTLVLVEHPPTVTMGRRATPSDLCLAESSYSRQGVALHKVNRGGLATAHEPGQLVAYPILVLKKHDLRWFAGRFLNVVVDLLGRYGLNAELKAGEPGVWVGGRKICSFGIALKKWICSHGIALNLNNSLETFAMIVPCGQPGEVVTSLARELGRPVSMDEAKALFVELFCRTFEYDPVLESPQSATVCAATGEQHAQSSN